MAKKSGTKATAGKHSNTSNCDTKTDLEFDRALQQAMGSASVFNTSGALTGPAKEPTSSTKATLSAPIIPSMVSHKATVPKALRRKVANNHPTTSLKPKPKPNASTKSNKQILDALDTEITTMNSVSTKAENPLATTPEPTASEAASTQAGIFDFKIQENMFAPPTRSMSISSSQGTVFSGQSSLTSLPSSDFSFACDVQSSPQQARKRITTFFEAGHDPNPAAAITAGMLPKLVERAYRYAEYSFRWYARERFAQMLFLGKLNKAITASIVACETEGVMTEDGDLMHWEAAYLLDLLTARMSADKASWPLCFERHFAYQWTPYSFDERKPTIEYVAPAVENFNEDLLDREESIVGATDMAYCDLGAMPYTAPVVEDDVDTACAEMDAATSDIDMVCCNIDSPVHQPLAYEHPSAEDVGSQNNDRINSLNGATDMECVNLGAMAYVPPYVTNAVEASNDASNANVGNEAMACIDPITMSHVAEFIKDAQKTARDLVKDDTRSTTPKSATLCIEWHTTRSPPYKSEHNDTATAPVSQPISQALNPSQPAINTASSSAEKATTSALTQTSTAGAVHFDEKENTDPTAAVSESKEVTPVLESPEVPITSRPSLRHSLGKPSVGKVSTLGSPLKPTRQGVLSVAREKAIAGRAVQSRIAMFNKPNARPPPVFGLTSRPLTTHTTATSKIPVALKAQPTKQSTNERHNGMKALNTSKALPRPANKQPSNPSRLSNSNVMPPAKTTKAPMKVVMAPPSTRKLVFNSPKKPYSRPSTDASSKLLAQRQAEKNVGNAPGKVLPNYMKSTVASRIAAGKQPMKFAEVAKQPISSSKATKPRVDQVAAQQVTKAPEAADKAPADIESTNLSARPTQEIQKPQATVLRAPSDPFVDTQAPCTPPMNWPNRTTAVNAPEPSEFSKQNAEFHRIADLIECAFYKAPEEVRGKIVEGLDKYSGEMYEILARFYNPDEYDDCEDSEDLSTDEELDTDDELDTDEDESDEGESEEEDMRTGLDVKE